LRQQTFIQRIIAFALLIVFSISAAPKAYFHDLIADHKDGIACCHSQTTSTCVHSQPFNCHFDELVVTASFLMEAVQFSFLSPIEFSAENDHYKSFYTFSSLFQKTGRGPPMAQLIF
jgi:hypothetical protein